MLKKKGRNWKNIIKIAGNTSTSDMERRMSVFLEKIFDLSIQMTYGLSPQPVFFG